MYAYYSAKQHAQRKKSSETPLKSSVTQVPKSQGETSGRLADARFSKAVALKAPLCAGEVPRAARTALVTEHAIKHPLAADDHAEPFARLQLW
jgi:hypothetical protein